MLSDKFDRFQIREEPEERCPRCEGDQVDWIVEKDMQYWKCTDCGCEWEENEGIKYGNCEHELCPYYCGACGLSMECEDCIAGGNNN